LAILPVILYHANSSIMPGGYIGVDIFFVISGFLITSLIVDEMEGGSFSVVKFYERRARRILPALFFVMGLSIPFAIALSDPAQLALFSKGLSAAALSVSNIFFERKENYFAPASEYNPLIHTWSLGVEEQFYIVFPLVAAVALLFGRRALAGTVIAGLVLSLGFSQYVLHHDAAANFYLIPTRAWELMIGALASLVTVTFGLRQRNVLSAIGALAVVLSLALFYKTTPMPSIFGLYPTIGTALILMFGTSDTLVGQILSTRFPVGVGLISYSAYLWHQPLFAFARMASLGEPSLALMLLLALAALVLAYFTWRYVESPFREPAAKGGFSRQQIFALSVAGIVGLALTGRAGAHWSHQLSPFSAPQYRAALSAKEDHASYYACMSGHIDVKNPQCMLGDESKDKLDFLVIGDSVAASYADGVSAAAKRYGLKGSLIAMGGCPPVEGLGGYFPDAKGGCDKMQRGMFRDIEAQGVKFVFLAATWPTFEGDEICKFAQVNCMFGRPSVKQVAAMIANTSRKINALGVHPIYITEPPRLWELDAPFYAMKAMRYRTNDTLTLPSRPSRLIGMLKQARASYTLIDSREGFCDSDGCDLVHEGLPIFWDRGHLTAHKSAAIAPIYYDAMTMIAGDRDPIHMASFTGLSR
jgi:peptidoglycan/LPS O-acetylase OafA/YrhL